MADDRTGSQLTSGISTDADKNAEATLRPQSLAEYVGQNKVRENLQIAIQAAQQRGEQLDHLLLHGPPGLGKTTLAYIVAKEMGVNITATSGPAIERTGDLAAILTNLRDHDIFFIDEVHRLNRAIEETLYPAMEDFKLDIVIGEGPGARSLKLDLPKFTLIGATTRAALLTSPLRDRFGLAYRMEFYEVNELVEIITRAAGVFGTVIGPDAAEEIARRSRATPRVANRLFKRVRDFAQVRRGGVIDMDAAKEALTMLEVDSMGLERMDRLILSSIIKKFGGGPVGLDTLAAVCSEEQDTIADVYEPYLAKIGFIQRTPRGRVATEHAYKHMNLKPGKEHGQSAIPFFDE